jgi:hypothetical protein
MPSVWGKTVLTCMSRKCDLSLRIDLSSWGKGPVASSCKHGFPKMPRICWRAEHTAAFAAWPLHDLLEPAETQALLHRTGLHRLYWGEVLPLHRSWPFNLLQRSLSSSLWRKVGVPRENTVQWRTGSFYNTMLPRNAISKLNTLLYFSFNSDSSGLVKQNYRLWRALPCVCVCVCVRARARVRACVRTPKATKRVCRR